VNLTSEISRLLDTGLSKAQVRSAVLNESTAAERRAWVAAWVTSMIDAEQRTRALVAEVHAERAARQQQAEAQADAARVRREGEQRQRDEDDERWRALWDSLTPEQQARERERNLRREERKRLIHAAWWEQVEDYNRPWYEEQRRADPRRAREQEQLDADLWAAMENWRTSIRLEVTAELLAATIALGDGTVVTWGEATPGQLRQRAGMLLAMARGDVKTAARLHVAAEMVEAAHVGCLNDLPAQVVP